MSNVQSVHVYAYWPIIGSTRYQRPVVVLSTTKFELIAVLENGTEVNAHHSALGEVIDDNVSAVGVVGVRSNQNLQTAWANATRIERRVCVEAIRSPLSRVLKPKRPIELRTTSIRRVKIVGVLVDVLSRLIVSIRPDPVERLNRGSEKVARESYIFKLKQ